jgi:hypothetical protein
VLPLGGGPLLAEHYEKEGAFHQLDEWVAATGVIKPDQRGQHASRLDRVRLADTLAPLDDLFGAFPRQDFGHRDCRRVGCRLLPLSGHALQKGFRVFAPCRRLLARHLVQEEILRIFAPLLTNRLIHDPTLLI